MVYLYTAEENFIVARACDFISVITYYGVLAQPCFKQGACAEDGDVYPREREVGPRIQFRLGAECDDSKNVGRLVATDCLQILSA